MLDQIRKSITSTLGKLRYGDQGVKKLASEVPTVLSERGTSLEALAKRYGIDEPMDVSDALVYLAIEGQAAFGDILDDLDTVDDETGTAIIREKSNLLQEREKLLLERSNAFSKVLPESPLDIGKMSRLFSLEDMILTSQDFADYFAAQSLNDEEFDTVSPLNQIIQQAAFMRLDVFKEGREPNVSDLHQERKRFDRLIKEWSERSARYQSARPNG